MALTPEQQKLAVQSTDSSAVRASKLKREDYQNPNLTNRQFVNPNTTIITGDRYTTYGAIDWKTGTQQQSAGLINPPKSIAQTKAESQQAQRAKAEALYQQQIADRDRARQARITGQEQAFADTGEERAYQEEGFNLADEALSDEARMTGDMTKKDLEDTLKEFKVGIEESLTLYGKELGQALYQQLQSFSTGFGQYKNRLQELLGANLAQGQMFDTTNESARKELEEAFKGNGNPSDIIKKYSISPNDFQRKQAEVKQVQGARDKAYGSGQDKRMVDETVKAYERGELSYSDAMQSLNADPRKPFHENKQAMEQAEPKEYQNLTEEQIAEGMVEKVGGMPMNEVYNFAMGFDMENSTSWDILRNLLGMEVAGAVQGSKKIETFLSAQELRALEHFKGGMEVVKAGREEIDKAIDGEEFVPSTIEGLYAKIATQSRDIQLESIETERAYMQQQHAVWSEIERDKRSRLEGYLRAKLHSVGAQDSSAGLATMAMMVTNADLRIQLAESEYAYGLSKLNTASRGIMVDYTNKITEIALGTQEKERGLASTLEESMDKIDRDRIFNEKEKQKLILSAFKDYSKEVAVLKKEEREQAWKEYEFSYKKTQDKIDQALKVSGLTGTIYGIDGNGDLYDTGVSTLDAKEFNFTKMIRLAQEERDERESTFETAFKLLEQGMDIETIEMVLGMRAGSLKGLKTQDEIKKKIKEEEEDRKWGFDNITKEIIDNGVSEALGEPSGSAISGAYAENLNIGLECGAFARRFYNLQPMGDLLTEKIESMGNTDLRTWEPQAGDMVILDYGAKAGKPNYGHVAIVNAVNADGTLTLTESNYAKKHTVTNTRIVPVDSRIRAVHRGDLKPEYQKSLDLQGKAKQAVALAWDNKIKAISEGLELSQAERQEMEEVAIRHGREEEFYNALKKGRGVSGTTGGTADKPTATFDEITRVRQEIANKPIAKSYTSYRESYNAMNASFEAYESGTVDPAITDQAITILFNKMLDEGSVVREGEFDRTSRGQDILSEWRGWLSAKAFGGTGITDAMRKSMVKIAKELMGAVQDQFVKDMGYYVNTESKYMNVEPERLLGSYWNEYLQATGEAEREESEENWYPIPEDEEQGEEASPEEPPKIILYNDTQL